MKKMLSENTPYPMMKISTGDNIRQTLLQHERVYLLAAVTFFNKYSAAQSTWLKRQKEITWYLILDTANRYDESKHLAEFRNWPDR